MDRPMRANPDQFLVRITKLDTRTRQDFPRS